MDARLDGENIELQLTADEAIVLYEWLRDAPAHGADGSVTSAMATLLEPPLQEALGDQYATRLEAARARLNPAE
jgi:hypothetical protein